MKGTASSKAKRLKGGLILMVSGLRGGVVPSSSDVSVSTAMQVGRKKKSQTKGEVRVRVRVRVKLSPEREAQTDMPELLLKSPASSPQDDGCQQNCTSNRTYDNVGAAGT